MTTALLAWEIGGGQGHLHKLATIAHELKTCGIQPVFALKNCQIKGLTLRGKVIQAPQATFKALDDRGDNKAYFYTDILYMFGFSSSLTLDFHFKAWQSVINIVQPSLIITDHAPALILAAKGRIPTIVIGSGFTVPPAIENFPPIRSSPIPNEAIKRCQIVAENVKKVTGFHAPLGYLLNGDRSFIFGIPQLDPYADVRDKTEYMGIHSAPFPQNLWDENGKAWAYLMDNWNYRDLVIDTFKANDDFGDLKYILKGKSFALHHASFGISMTCLLAGIPQLVFAKDLETSLTAKRLIDLGVAIAILQPFTRETLLEATAYLPQISKNAQQKAKQLAYWNQSFLDTIIQSCLEFVD
ncbi:MAG: hypothetical protein WBA39_21745 [Rivularia sp. (in: cyanobacteria)]